MANEQRVGLAVKAAAQAWMGVWLLWCVLSCVRYCGIRRYADIVERIEPLVFVMVVTGFITFFAPLFLVVPYVLWRDPEKILKKTWRMYIETLGLALLATALVAFVAKSEAETYLDTFFPIAIFAMAVSSLACFLYLRKLRRCSPSVDKTDDT